MRVKWGLPLTFTEVTLRAPNCQTPRETGQQGPASARRRRTGAVPRPVQQPPEEAGLPLRPPVLEIKTGWGEHRDKWSPRPHSLSSWEETTSHLLHVDLSALKIIEVTTARHHFVPIRTARINGMDTRG